MLHTQNPQAKIRLVINRVTSQSEGRNTANKLAMVAKRFLNMDIATLGFVPDDPHVSKAVKQQRPFLLTYPHSQASRGIRELVEAYLGSSATTAPNENGGLRGFLTKLKHYIR
jgi:flagellar biosynthesis protein FlhG